MDPFTDYSVLLWGSNRTVEALTRKGGGLYSLESPGFLLRAKLPLGALFCLLPGLPRDPACLPLLCECDPTLVLLGFLPLTYLGRLIQSF